MRKPDSPDKTLLLRRKIQIESYMQMAIAEIAEVLTNQLSRYIIYINEQQGTETQTP